MFNYGKTWNEILVSLDGIDDAIEWLIKKLDDVAVEDDEFACVEFLW